METILSSSNIDEFREVHKCVLHHRSGHLNTVVSLNVFILESVSLQLILFLLIRYKCISLAPCVLQCMIKSEIPVMLHAAVVLLGKKIQAEIRSMVKERRDVLKYQENQ